MFHERLASREHAVDFAELQPHAIQLHLRVQASDQPQQHALMSTRRRDAPGRVRVYACPPSNVPGQIATPPPVQRDEALGGESGSAQVTLSQLRAADGNLSGPALVITTNVTVTCTRRGRVHHVQLLVEQGQ